MNPAAGPPVSRREREADLPSLIICWIRLTTVLSSAEMTAFPDEVTASTEERTELPPADPPRHISSDTGAGLHLL